jgi:hypothetical protein
MHHAGAAMHHSLHVRDPNPYFQHATTAGYSASSGAHSPLRHLAPEANPRPSSPSKAANSPGRSSPAMMVDSFAPFAGTSPNEFPYAQHLQERFPFAQAETHAATASCG